MIVAAIASLAALAGVGLVHEVNSMNPAHRLTDGRHAHRGRRRGDHASHDVAIDVSPAESLDHVVKSTALRHDTATLGDR